MLVGERSNLGGDEPGRDWMSISDSDVDLDLCKRVLAAGVPGGETNSSSDSGNMHNVGWD